MGPTPFLLAALAATALDTRRSGQRGSADRGPREPGFTQEAEDWWAEAKPWKKRGTRWRLVFNQRPSSSSSAKRYGAVSVRIYMPDGIESLEGAGGKDQRAALTALRGKVGRWPASPLRKAALARITEGQTTHSDFPPKG
jgi:hypothetical protein